MIKLYATTSPNVRKVMIMLEELELPYSLRFTDVFGGEQFTPDFLALNPLGRVPVMIDPAAPGGEALFESGAILIYLAERHARADLLASDGAARYAALKWLMFQMGSVGPIFGQHNHFIIVPDEAQGYAGRRYREQAWHLYRILETRLGDVPWLAGGAYSIADIATYPWALYVRRHGFDWADLPRLADWRDRIQARPAVSRADARMAEFAAANAHIGQRASQAGLDRFFWREQGGPPADLSPMKVR
jgi:GST-like protein